MVEALAPVSISSPVQASAPTPSESPKPKKVIVIKKTSDGKMKLVKNEKPALKDGASFVPSIGLTPDGKHLLCANLFELKPFTNQSMIPSMGKIPYFTLTADEKEQSKKDRIIDTINYKFNFEFFYEKDDIPAYEKTICYQQIICQMLHEDDFEYWLNFEVPKLTQRKFELLVHVEW